MALIAAAVNDGTDVIHGDRHRARRPVDPSR
jgi:hypothetical protein